MSCRSSATQPLPAPPPPAETLHAAVHRQAAGSGDAAWAPEEALTVAQALAAHTAAGAAAAGLERELGRIQPGMLADFAVLSGPPGAAAGVQQAFVGGVCRFDASTRAWAPGVGAAGEL